MAFKRKRVNAPFMRSSRRRSTGRFKSTRRRRSGATRSLTSRSSQFGKAAFNGFRSRKVRTSTFRRWLWRDTAYKAHYRSVAALSADVSTPNHTVQATWGTNRALFNGVGDFWTTAGGATPIDEGTTVPTFGETIVLRGGLARITFSSNATDDAVRIRCWAVWAKSNPALTISSPVPLEWDPSCWQDFARFGRVLDMREIMLIPGSRPFDMTWRYRPQKIDKEIFNTSNGNQLYWMYTISQTNNTEGPPATAEVVRVTVSYNTSFSADEVD